MIVYDRLWKTLAIKGITKYRLKKDYHISQAQFDRLKRNESVTTSTIDKLCNLLECDIIDIMEHIPDGNTFLKRKSD